jgi:F-type H+-transporting ATPase subunit b
LLAVLVAMAFAVWAAVSAAQGHGSSEHAAPAPTAHDAKGEGHGEGAHAQGGHGAGAHHGPKPINWTDIFNKEQPAVLALVINFGLLMALYYVLGKKPVAEALKQRRAQIGEKIEEAQGILAEAKERAKKYQGDLKNADADAETARAGLIAAGKGEVERMLAEAQERAARMKRDAERLVEQEKKQLAVDLHRETVELAASEASQLLEKSVTADDHQRLAQDLLAELAKKPAAPRAAAAGSMRPGGPS